MNDKKEKPPKKVSYEVLTEDEEPYEVMKELVDKHHQHLRLARILLAWNTSWKENSDGKITLGQCRKMSDLDRDIHEYDFVIILNKEFWMSFNDEQRRALLDHELCHAQVKTDEHGEPERDERNRIIWRIRQHDVEEFGDVIKRHGLYKHDLEIFALALKSRDKAPV